MDQPPDKRDKKVVVVGAIDSDAAHAIADAVASTSISESSPAPPSEQTAAVQPQPQQTSTAATNQLAVACPAKDAAADSDSDEDESKCGPSGCPPNAGGAQRSNAVLPPFATEPKDDNAEPVPIDPDVMLIDPECVELELNHCRIGRIEALEPLTKIER